MGSMSTKGSVLLFLLVSFIFIASDEMVGAVEEQEMACAEEMVGDICYWKNESFGVCIVAQNCSKDCVKKGYKMGGKCKGVRRYCYCMKECSTMDE